MPQPDPTPKTRVELCGALRVEITGRRVEPGLRGDNSRVLFACLVINRDRPLPRDVLADAIWRERPPKDADAALCTQLSRLRDAVGRERVHGRRELSLDLGRDARVDWEVARDAVGAAEARLIAGDAAGALRIAREGLVIARKELLPGLSTPWVEERRRELRELAVTLLETAARAALALGGEHLPLAERWAGELIKLEQYRESAYKLLMEVHERSGNFAQGLRVYAMLRRLLDVKLGTVPNAELRALNDRLLACENAPAAEQDERSPLPRVLATFAELPFAGCERELERVTGALTGSSRLIAVTGATGAGKTRLLAELAAHAHRAGHAVLHGRAERDGALAFAPFVSALREHLAPGAAIAAELAPLLAPELSELARFVPALRTVAAPAEGPVDTQGVCDAIAGLLDARARRRPVLLVLEDLQWADRPTLLALRHVLNTTDVTIAVAARDDLRLRMVLEDARRDLTLEHVALSPARKPERSLRPC